jgi:hypothetical protein
MAEMEMVRIAAAAAAAVFFSVLIQSEVLESFMRVAVMDLVMVVVEVVEGLPSNITHFPQPLQHSLMVD